nr:MAG TPA: Transcriptional regulatory protein RcsB factor, DNA BINDING PROTEIN.6A [Caudoviricetes sp.]
MDRPGLNRVVIEEFSRLAFLTPVELDVLTTRAAGKSQKWQEQNLHVSLASITRIVRRLQRKYDAVKEYSAILPDDLII